MLSFISVRRHCNKQSVTDLNTVAANFTKSAVKLLMIAVEFANLVRSDVDLIADAVRWLRSVAELITNVAK